METLRPWARAEALSGSIGDDDDDVHLCVYRGIILT